MTEYEFKKEKAREEAIFWQSNISSDIKYLEDLQEWYEYFSKLGKRYGLLKEFRENGIC